jgi:hypothetical protein
MERVANDNPWFTTYEYLHRFTRDNFFGKLQLDWQMGKNFSLLARTGMDNVKENYELRKSWGSRSDKYGQFVQGTNSNLLTSSDVILTYNNNFNKFSLSASVGGNYSYSNTPALEATAGDLSTPALFNLANAAPGTLSITSGAKHPII